MLGLTNSTPTYQGGGQPQANGGCVAGILGYLFGSNTPAYAGNGQPTSSSGGLLGGLSGSSPGYKSAPSTTQSPPPGTVDAVAPGDGGPAPNGMPPGVYVCIP